MNINEQKSVVRDFMESNTDAFLSAIDAGLIPENMNERDLRVFVLAVLANSADESNDVAQMRYVLDKFAPEPKPEPKPKAKPKRKPKAKKEDW